jgi:hypothetical protein
MANMLRWILIPPAAVAAWYLAFVIGIALEVGLNALCPADQVVSGWCIAPWYRGASNALLWFGAGLAALLVLFACTLLAPTHKRHVAIVTFVVGAAVAARMGFGIRAYGALVAATVAGALGLWLLLRRLNPPMEDSTAP